MADEKQEFINRFVDKVEGVDSPFSFQLAKSIDWKTLGGTLVGSVVYAFFWGISDFIVAVRNGMTGLIDGVARFNAGVIQGLFGAIADASNAAWLNAASGFGDLGVFANVIAVAELMLVLYIVTRAAGFASGGS